MKLEDIGFYTLSNDRAKNVSLVSPLKRRELILTSRCNFKCTYCRGMKTEDKGDISKNDAFNIVSQWANHNLENIRFSGGEPTLWPHLIDLVAFSKKLGIKRIAVSSNGSNDIEYYKKLKNAGVNDFSISLDSCCSASANKIAGGLNIWDKVVSNIKSLSQISYTTVGVVLTEENYSELNDTIEFASGLGVSDIRIIPAAQISKKLKDVKVNQILLNKHPILKYRYNNFVNEKPVRGLSEIDHTHCPLVLDDMAVLNNKHYPCIIYMREHGNHIGETKDNIQKIRQDRFNWFKTHDCYSDEICRNNCLDVCVDYNNSVKRMNHNIY